MICSLTIIGADEPWTPNVTPQPLSAQMIGATSGPVYQGALVWEQHGCQDCHAIDGRGGARGPDLTDVGNRLTANEVTIRALGGGTTMPAYANVLTPGQVEELVAFLESRKMQTGTIPSGQALSRRTRRTASTGWALRCAQSGCVSIRTVSG